MSLLITISLLSIWFYLGWLILEFARIEDLTMRGLLAPAVGIAIVTLITTTASFCGLPISRSKWIIVLLVVSSGFLMRRTSWIELKPTARFHLFVFALNLITVGIGLVIFGPSWHGLINEDAATNSLAAQYFISHFFYETPTINSIISGTDYSPLSSMLYVAGGHRFGDVMLLGFSATLFSLNPDEVYMAHALAIRCALIATSVLLIYQRRSPAWVLYFTMAVLTLSPLGIYTYLNQLISQMGGFTMLLAAGVLFNVLLDHPDRFSRLGWPIAIVLAALCQSYPESVSLLALGILLLVSFRATKKELPPFRKLFGFAVILCLVVLLFLNFSLPNVLSHLLSIAGWGLAKTQDLPTNTGEFAYAFTPDVFSIILGFQGLREVIAEPWALTLQVSALFLAATLFMFAIFRNDRYPLLVSLCLSSAIAFAFLTWQRNGFGTFKMMLLVQPLLFVLLSAFLIDLVMVRKVIGVVIGFGILILVGKTGAAYVNAGMSTFGHITRLAEGDTLNTIQRIISSSSKEIILESPNYLFGKFALLRAKGNPTVFEHNLSESFASSGLKRLLANDLARWRPDQDKFSDDLFKYYEERFGSAIFQCRPVGLQPKFKYLLHDNESKDVLILAPGGRLIPLNRNLYGDTDVKLLDRVSAPGFLLFRPSTLGGYYGKGAAAFFDVEPDLLTSGTMSGAGRYVLLEVLAPFEDEIRLTVKFSRTYLGGSDALLPEITLNGTTSTPLGVAGAGAVSLTSEPLRPCIVNGRSYILVDFGAEPTQPRKKAPWAYQMSGVPYHPDTRQLVGFLRDISVVRDNPPSDPKALSQLVNQWSFQAFDSAFEYSGVFEDGWMSNQLLLRPKLGLQGKKIYITMDVPLELVRHEPLISIEIDGKTLRQQRLSTETVTIQIDLPNNVGQSIVLTTDRPFILPGADGRSVIGHIRSISLD